MGINSVLDSFKVGVTIQLFDEKDELVENVRVVKTKRNPKGRAEVVVQSLTDHPDDEPDTFAHFPEHNGWKLIFPDPMTGNPVFSQRGHTYNFKPAEA